MWDGLYSRGVLVSYNEKGHSSQLLSVVLHVVFDPGLVALPASGVTGLHTSGPAADSISPLAL